MADENEKLKELVEKAHLDKQFRIKLLTNPDTVAQEMGVKLGKREIERLKKVGAFAELANEAKIGRIFQCNPHVCYPSTVWLRDEILELLKHLGAIRVGPSGHPPLPPNGYPASFERIMERVSQNLRIQSPG